MKNLTKNCSFPHALALDAFKYFITGELNHKESEICNLYESRYTDSREKAENVMLQAEQALIDAEFSFKDMSQGDFNDFIEDLNDKLYNNLID